MVKRRKTGRVCALPWHTKSIFVKCDQPPEKPYSAAVCRDLPGRKSRESSVTLSRKRQNAASQCRQWQSNGSKKRDVLLPRGEGDKRGKLEFVLILLSPESVSSVQRDEPYDHCNCKECLSNPNQRFDVKHLTQR